MGQTATPFVLSEADLTTLNNVIRKGKESVRKLNRVRALQFSHQGQHPEQISNLLGISVATVYNLRKRYREEGVNGPLAKRPALDSPAR